MLKSEDVKQWLRPLSYKFIFLKDLFSHSIHFTHCPAPNSTIKWTITINPQVFWGTPFKVSQTSSMSQSAAPCETLNLGYSDFQPHLYSFSVSSILYIMWPANLFSVYFSNMGLLSPVPFSITPTSSAPLTLPKQTAHSDQSRLTGVWQMDGQKTGSVQTPWHLKNWQHNQSSVTGRDRLANGINGPWKVCD